MSRKLLFVFFTLLLFFTSGCAAPHLDLSFKRDLPATRNFMEASASVGVSPFIDLRPQAHGSENQKWLGMIPGILWLEIGTDIPEIYTAFSPFDAKPISESMAEAVADLLKQSKVAGSVIYLPHHPDAQVDYRLEGRLHKTLLTETCYYYGSSLYAWATRVFGLPYVSYDVVLDVELQLKSNATGSIIWSGRLKGEGQDKYNTVYRLAKGKEGKHVIAHNFSELLASEMVRILPELEHVVVSP